MTITHLTKWRIFHSIIILLLLAACSGSGPEWKEVHNNAIVFDGHADTIQRVYLSDHNLGTRNQKGHIDIPRMIEGGLDAVFFSIWIDPIYENRASAVRTLQLLDSFYNEIKKNESSLQLALNASDVENITKNGKIAALIGIEGGHAIEDDPGLLRSFHKLGVRYMTLTHSNTNNWCDSSGDDPKWNGINELGEEIIREMNRIGMIIDISHVSDEAFYDIMNITTKPVIASHSAVRSLCNVPRNLTDDMIKAIADIGGVVCVNFYSGFLDESYNERYDIYRQNNPAAAPAANADLDETARMNYLRYEDPTPVESPPFEKLIEHIDYVVKLVGADHAGLGSDFDGITNSPDGL
ncbi:dipeptidase, partial [candidate division KSB1 bacterium]